MTEKALLRRRKSCLLPAYATEPGLATQLVADTDSGEALPLLAFILRQLAEGLSVGGTVALSLYHDLGGVRGALTRHADAAFTDAVQASGLTHREVLTGLTRLVTVDETGRRSRRRVRLTSLPEPLRVALQVFVEGRLLLSDTEDDGQVWLTVAHEALLSVVSFSSAPTQAFRPPDQPRWMAQRRRLRFRSPDSAQRMATVSHPRPGVPAGACAQ